MNDSKLKKHASTFYFASQFLTAQQLDTAAGLYAICREIDDIADQASHLDAARSRLLALRRALHSRDLSCVLVKQAMSLQPQINIDILIELVDGVIQDTHPVRLDTEAHLLSYCYRVAGTVGLMMCDIFAVHDAKARHHAIDLGVAMQLTNICRDVFEDAQAGRRYLPASLVGELSPEQILEPTQAQAETIKRAVSKLLAAADVRYQSGFMGLPFLATRPRIAILIAGLVYRQIGTIISRRECDVWQGRAYTSKICKVRIATGALMTYLFSSKYHHYRGHHDASLHTGMKHHPGVHLAS